MQKSIDDSLDLSFVVLAWLKNCTQSLQDFGANRALFFRLPSTRFLLFQLELVPFGFFSTNILHFIILLTSLYLIYVVGLTFGMVFNFFSCLPTPNCPCPHCSFPTFVLFSNSSFPTFELSFISLFLVQLLHRFVHSLFVSLLFSCFSCVPKSPLFVLHLSPSITPQAGTFDFPRVIRVSLQIHRSCIHGQHWVALWRDFCIRSRVPVVFVLQNSTLTPSIYPHFAP